MNKFSVRSVVGALLVAVPVSTAASALVVFYVFAWLNSPSFRWLGMTVLVLITLVGSASLGFVLLRSKDN